MPSPLPPRDHIYGLHHFSEASGLHIRLEEHFEIVLPAAGAVAALKKRIHLYPTLRGVELLHEQQPRPREDDNGMPPSLTEEELR